MTFTRFYLLLTIYLFFSSCSQVETAKYEGHGAESITKDDLKKYAPATFSKEKTTQIESMLEIKSTGMGAITEDGKNLYFGWSVSGNYHVWKVDGPNRFPIQMTGGQDSTYFSGFSVDGKYIYLSRDRNGDEYPGIYQQSVDGGALETIFYQEKAKSRLIWIDEDGKHLYLRTNDRNPELFAIYKYNLATKEKELLLEKSGYWGIADKRKDGTLLLSYYKGSSASEYYTFDEKTKKLTPLLGQEENTMYQILFAKDKDTYLVLTDKFSNYSQIYTYRNGKFSPFGKKEKFEISYISTDYNKKRLVVSINENGYMKLRVYNLSNLKQIKLPNFKDATSVYMGFTTNNSRFSSIAVTKAKSPSVNYIYDWEKRKLTQWTLPSSPEVNTSRFAVDKLEYYPARDGTPIPMFVKRPDQCKNKTCPVIVNFHGGPESQSTANFSPYSQLFVDEGFIYVRPNVRGSRGYGKKWLNSDNGPKRLDVITDIEDCAIFIKKTWNKTGTPKVGIMGGSYGGYSTLVGMTMFAGSYDAGAASVGMSSLVTFLQNTAPYRRKHRESEYGYLDKDMEALKKLSPVSYIDKIQDPILILHGANDPRVPVGEALQIQKTLERKGLESELVVFPDEGHGIRKKDNRVLGIAHKIEFFKKHLLK